MGLSDKFAVRKRKPDPVRDIISNLRNVLNTKRAFGSMIQDFGIGDYHTRHSRKVIIDTLIEELKENIRNYEPRVKLIDIREVPSDVAFRIRFELKCLIVDHSEPIFIIFDSVLNKVTVDQ